MVGACSGACCPLCHAGTASGLRGEGLPVIELVAAFMAAWVTGYVLGFKVRMIRSAYYAT